MTGKEIHRLGTCSDAARACIPMHLQQTAPRLVWNEGWAAQFWYYEVDGEDLTVREPQFFLELELPSGHPIQMKRLTVHPASLGEGKDILEPSFHLFLEDYLDRCTGLLEGAPDQLCAEKLLSMWAVTHPFPIARWFQEHQKEETGKISSSENAEDLLLRQDPVAYWKREQARAIRAGDDEAAQRARQEMNRAAEARRKR